MINQVHATKIRTSHAKESIPARKNDDNEGERQYWEAAAECDEKTIGAYMQRRDSNLMQKLVSKLTLD